MNIETRNKIINAVLLIVIVGLSYYLYHSIVDPYEAVMRQKEVTQTVRDRMVTVREAIVLYRNKKGKFPSNLDTMVTVLKSDSLISARADSLFGYTFKNEKFSFEKLLQSPRTQNKFKYTLNDTIRPNIYLLEDPDTEDRI
ncbi:MAG: hypothetical protein V2J13_11020, partial [Cycloclasticus sp.]|nr:hypothetical protein [Cycloclasticus sp.]